MSGNDSTPFDEAIVLALRRFDTGEDPALILADHSRYKAVLLDIFLGTNIYHQTGRQLRYLRISVD